MLHAPASLTVTETRIFTFLFQLAPEVRFSFDLKAQDEAEAKVRLKRYCEQMIEDLDASLYETGELKS